MTKIQLNQKEQHYAGTRELAEEIVLAAKENDSLQMHKITEKHNKKGKYYLIDLTYSYQTPIEVMESKPKDDAPEGQMSIDDHEGLEYSVDGDGTVSSVTGSQLSNDDESDEPTLQRVK